MEAGTDGVTMKLLSRRRAAKLLEVLVVGGTVLAATASAGCATSKTAEGAKPADQKPADQPSGGGGVQGW